MSSRPLYSPTNLSSKKKNYPLYTPNWTNRFHTGVKTVLPNWATVSLSLGTLVHKLSYFVLIYQQLRVDETESKEWNTFVFATQKFQLCKFHSINRDEILVETNGADMAVQL
jgi:hypothetical protein